MVELTECGMQDVSQVGGKNASLGEMIQALAHAGVSVPLGFATTADAFRDFLDQQGLARSIDQRLKVLDVDDVDMLTVVIVGSTQSRAVAGGDGEVRVYTPRGYSTKPDSGMATHSDEAAQ